MAYYRVITPAGHLARGTVVTDDEAATLGAPHALFTILPKTAAAMVQNGALEPIPDPVPPVSKEPGWGATSTPDPLDERVTRRGRKPRKKE